MSCQEKGAVNHLKKRLTAVLALKVLIGIISAVGVISLAAVVIDAVVILPQTFRQQALWPLIMVCIGVIIGGGVMLNRLTDNRVARLFELTLPNLGTSLTNSVQLENHPTLSPVMEVLRRDAVTYGREQAADLSVWPVVRRGMQLFFAFALLTAFSWGIGRLCFPDVLEAVLPRYLDPAGDHPPYSVLKIETTASTDTVLYGGQVELQAVAAGAPVEKLFVVAEDSRGINETVMLRRSDKTYFQTLTNLREPVTLWVTDGRARSYKKTISIKYTPRINLVEIGSVAPAYTGLRPRTQQLKQQTLKFPVATAISFKIASNRPLRSGTIRLTPVMGGEQVDLKLLPQKDNPNVVVGEFVLKEAVTFSINVTDVESLDCYERRNGRILIRPDRRPRVFVIEPGKDAVATPNVTVPISVEAEDDYAVAKILWFRSLNGSPERHRLMSLKEKRGPGLVEAYGGFNLADLGVRPGDMVEYFFEAVDNNPVEPQVATSKVYRLQIISEAQFNSLMRNARAKRRLLGKYMELNNHLRRIAESSEYLRDQAKNNASKDALKKDADDLSREMSEYQKAMDKALAEKPDFDVEKSFLSRLREQEKELKRLRNALDELRKKGNLAGSKGELEKLTEGLRSLAGLQDRTVGKPAQQIAAVARLLAKAAEFSRLAKQQEHLARIAKRFKDHKGVFSRLQQMELQEITDSETNVRDALKNFMTELPELLAEVPQEAAYDDLRKSVNEFMVKAEGLQIQDDLDVAVDRFSQLETADGCGRAEIAADKMMSLVARAEGMSGEGMSALRFQPSIGSSLGDSLSQMMSAMSGGSSGDGDGFGMANRNIGMYGPNIELDGSQSGGDRKQSGRLAERHQESIESDGEDPVLKPVEVNGRVKLQRDVKFPLRYRNLVGEYFRAVAESQE